MDNGAAIRCRPRETGVGQFFQMKRQRGIGKIELFGNPAHRHALRARDDEQTKDRES